LARSTASQRNEFIALGYALVPLGLAAWIGFSLSFVFTNFSYVWPAFSDPLGWGWDLIGTAGVPWMPYLGNAVPLLQALVLLAGLGWASLTARRIAGEKLTPRAANRQALPVVVFCLLVTFALLILFIA
jgi:hypothetical protein